MRSLEYEADKILEAIRTAGSNLTRGGYRIVSVPASGFNIAAELRSYP
ncbi:MAG: hypothetical protein JXB26_13295 [Candidatus Aminicenantes bacterium]|nr:hypothetical protein [Candidatus Aminicenantes bacterium]